MKIFTEIEQQDHEEVNYFYGPDTNTISDMLSKKIINNKRKAKAVSF